jgi:hypothetical protein
MHKFMAGQRLTAAEAMFQPTFLFALKEPMNIEDLFVNRYISF